MNRIEEILMWIEIGYRARQFESMQPPDNPILPERIIGAVCKHFETSPEILAAKTRRREIVTPRHVAMYLLATMTKMTLKSIGSLFWRDHTSVIHARDTIIDLMSNDNTLSAQVAYLRESILTAHEQQTAVMVEPMPPKQQPTRARRDRRRILSATPPKKIIRMHQEPPAPIVRPPAEYSNNGFINLSKRLAQ